MLDIQDQSAISVYDADHPNSVVNIIGVGLFGQCVAKLPDNIKEKSEEDFKDNPKITDTERALRIQFWQEFNRRIDRKSGTFCVANVWQGVCSDKHFFKSICATPEKLAFILLPPRNYDTDLRLVLDLASAKRKEILGMDSYVTSRSGERTPNDKLIALQIKLLEAIENRLFGTAIARSASVETQVKADSEQGKTLIKQLTHDEASKEIRRLASRVEELKSGGEVIDADICE